MNTEHNQSAAVRAVVAYAAFEAAHWVGDYLVQQDTDAKAKGKHGPAGIAACARHTASYTATQALALYAANRYLRVGITWRRAAAGLALSAATHFVADRCAGHWSDDSDDAPLLVRAAHAAGHSGWLVADPGAGPLMDQAWHHGWIALAAVVVSGQDD
ncbi:hypothetical protein OG896_24800 [Streptomyces sp. NBC_00669]|uniref:hypothetical protein n=1 Tax=Streptomyces sp. NBC_00669 TaxID=2976011 RepID=UPI002E2F9C8B|nr:hypothetical protein [Streptomyces sp. NBC_00669]